MTQISRLVVLPVSVTFVALAAMAVEAKSESFTDPLKGMDSATFEQYTGRPRPGGDTSYGTRDSSDVQMLDVDKTYDSQYDPYPPRSSYEPPRTPDGKPGCPDGSAPTLGFCGNDIPYYLQ